MRLTRALGSFALLIALAATVSALDKKADELPALHTATGVVDKADKESLSVKPRGTDGKFQKTLALRVTNTSKVTILTPQKRGDKTVLGQREADVKDLIAGQTVAVVYAEAGKDDPVLLTAVAHPAK